jgi:hypothetical protein
MKPIRDWAYVMEVELEESSEEEEPEEEDQVDATIVTIKATWLDIVLIQGGLGAFIAEPMGTQLKTAHK